VSAKASGGHSSTSKVAIELHDNQVNIPSVDASVEFLLAALGEFPVNTRSTERAQDVGNINQGYFPMLFDGDPLAWFHLMQPQFEVGKENEIISDIALSRAEFSSEMANEVSEKPRNKQDVGEMAERSEPPTKRRLSWVSKDMNRAANTGLDAVKEMVYFWSKVLFYVGISLNLAVFA
jgi:hypothetical protein